MGFKHLKFSMQFIPHQIAGKCSYDSMVLKQSDIMQTKKMPLINRNIQLQQCSFLSNIEVIVPILSEEDGMYIFNNVAFSLILPL